MLTMIHANGVRIDRGVLRVDRKFHTGMLAYLESLDEPVMSVHPQAAPDAQVMDAVELPLDQLGYQVMTLALDRARQPLAADAARLRAQVERSRVLYGAGFGAAAHAQACQVPYVLSLEKDLYTQVLIATRQVSNPVHRGVRAARCAIQYVREISVLRRAAALHCNGYPVYDEARLFNSNRLLYLDSRMSTSFVISEERLRKRLGERSKRRLRLLFSGRYEPIKGVLDAVQVGVECLRRGIDLEMHFYGEGALRAEMAKLVADSGHGALIHIHDAVSYPELVEISQSFDVFVCCHVQGDPSCTYLESFGAGLPVVGYGNRMWRRLSEESRVGSWSKVGDPNAVADDIAALASDIDRLAAMSLTARAFALAHSFEREFRRRTDGLNELLERSKPGRSGASAASDAAQ